MNPPWFKHSNFKAVIGFYVGAATDAVHDVDGLWRPAAAAPL